MLDEINLENSKTKNVISEALSPVDLLDQLGNVYDRQDKTDDFKNEKNVYQKLLPKLIEHLENAGYVLKSPLAIGSTASVWEVYDKGLLQKRALKFPRPRLGKLKNIVRVLRAERERLAALNHQNIIKIYSSGEVDLAISKEEYSFPYFVMEYLEGIQDLDDYIISNLQSLTAEEIISYFRDLLSGISFLHAQKIIHCDIKPGNLLKAPGSSALVADLGYAKHFDKLPHEEKKITQVVHTSYYAHPDLGDALTESSDSNANIAEISRDRLKIAFDLFAFGRSMQEILIKIRDEEKADPTKSYGKNSIFTSYQWSYLGYISKRLLDGLVVKHADDDLNADVIPGLPDEIMPQLCYQTADEAVENFEKLLHLYDLEGEIPELNPNLSTYIQIPHCQVPLTRRVQEIINHPSFRRLALVTQLGFVSLIYPSAIHSRFEHVLGTFTHCCDYLRALWFDQANGLFQSIMSKKDIELCLLAALLHDIGQYPMAHDLAEVASDFVHENFTEYALLTEDPSSGESLFQVISVEWEIEISDVMALLNADKNSTFRNRILKSIINGPLDCDKLDYLKRDSTHLGVNFGLSIDHERLLRNLTVAYRSSGGVTWTDEGREVPLRELITAEIGVTEKALVVAQSLWKVRKDMFSQIYWHHTTRALKAMLGYVVRNTLLKLNTEDMKTQFWADFQKFIFSPLAYNNSQLMKGIGNPEPDQELNEDTPNNVADIWQSESPDNYHFLSTTSQLHPTDDLLLMFFWQYASDEEKQMIQAIRLRKVYRRLAVLSGTRRHREGNSETTMYEEIYRRFQTYRLDGNLELIEQHRREWEQEIIERVEILLTTKPHLLHSNQSYQNIIDALRKSSPLILVDIPIKATSISSGNECLMYLPEDYVGVHSRLPGTFPQFTPSAIELERTSFDREVGKIRVLVHPQWADLLVRWVPEQTILQIISGT
jgi:HD superfamily phosphohydrolase